MSCGHQYGRILAMSQPVLLGTIIAHSENISYKMILLSLRSEKMFSMLHLAMARLTAYCDRKDRIRGEHSKCEQLVIDGAISCLSSLLDPLHAVFADVR